MCNYCLRVLNPRQQVSFGLYMFKIGLVFLSTIEVINSLNMNTFFSKSLQIFS